MNYFKKIIATTMALVLLWPSLSLASGKELEESLSGVVEANKSSLEVIIFTMPSCPHCLRAKDLLDSLQQDKGLAFSYQEHDISKPADQVQEIYDYHQVPSKKRGLVPVIFLNNEYYLGFSDEVAQTLENQIRGTRSSRRSCQKHYQTTYFRRD